MKCPVCGKKMKRVHWEGTSSGGETMEEMWDCSCGVRCEHCCGNEQFTRNGKLLDENGKMLEE